MRRIIQIGIPIFIIIALIIPFLRVEKDVAFDTFNGVFDAYVSEDMVAQDSAVLQSNYQIQESDMEGFISFGPASYINVDEITLFYQSDETLRAQLYEKVETHIANQLQSFEGYGVEQTKLLNNAKVVERGNYIICIVSTQAEDVLNTFNNQFR